MAGPMIGMLGKAVGAMFGQPGRLGARRPRRRGAHRLRHRPAAGPRPARPPCSRTTSTAFAEGLDVREDDVLLYLALREAAHQRLFAHVPWLRDAPDRRGRGLRPRASTIDIAGIEETMEERLPASTRPTWRPCRRRCEGGLFESQRLPPQKAALAAARDHPRPRRGLGRRGRRPGHRRADARRGQAAGGRPPPPCRRRSGRADLRLAGRARAATAPAARRLDAVGLAAHPPGRRGPRRRSGCTPTCCRPPPTSTTRSASARTSGRCRAAQRRRLRRRAAATSSTAGMGGSADGPPEEA